MGIIFMTSHQTFRGIRLKLALSVLGVFFHQSDSEMKDEGEIMSLDEMIEEIVEEFKKDPRNKVFAPEAVLLASAKEETGDNISKETLRPIIEKHQNGELDDDDYDVLDGAVYACSVLARKCFGENPEDKDVDVDYQISWLENNDGSYVAEIRPN